MFAAEIHIRDEDTLADAMTGMREWLDRRRFEPSMFRYIFGAQGFLMHVEFPMEDQAVKFAAAFRGQVVPLPAAPAPVRRFINGAGKGEGANRSGS